MLQFCIGQATGRPASQARLLTRQTALLGAALLLAGSVGALALAGEVQEGMAESLENGNQTGSAPAPIPDGRVEQTAAAEPVFGPVGLTAGEMAEMTASSKPVPNVPTDPVSASIIERVNARWTALSKRDFSTAYSFETPAYRAARSAEDFSGQFGPYAVWHGIEPLGISYVDDAVADVTFLLDVTVTDMQTDKQVRLKQFVKERWVHEAEEWWHQSQSVNISGMAQDDTSQ